MSHSPLPTILTAGLLLLVGCARPAADLPAEAPAEEKGTPVPAHATVSITPGQTEYFLGEDVLLEFCIENTGTEPFKISLGGDYRGASRHLGFHVQAFDATGKLCDDPDPSGVCFGGIGHSPTVEPGKKHSESIPLLRYRRIENPGIYNIRVSHSLGWSERPDRKIPVAETTITFIKPSEEKARERVEAMLKSPDTDFSLLRDPVYLPVLLERAKEKSEQAVEGIGSIATPRATEALIKLAGDEDAQFALRAAQALDMRLPDPQLKNELPGRGIFHNDHLEARRWLVEQSWEPHFADDVADLAHKFLAREDRHGLECGGFMLQCVGRSADLPHLIRALDREIAAVAKRPFEDRQYPRPRGACRELLRAARVLSAGGLKEPLEIKTAGEGVVFVCAIGTTDKYRPKGWERDYARMLRHEAPYVREVALDNLPLPAPELLLKLLPPLITDKDVDVQIAACDVAEKTKRPEFKEPVLKAFAAAREEWLLRAADKAAVALDAKWERLEILVARLDEEGMTVRCLNSLADIVVGGFRSGASDKLTANDAKACKALWVKFLQEHDKQLKAGQLFKRDDPAITPDLFPRMDLGS